MFLPILFQILLKRPPPRRHCRLLRASISVCFGGISTLRSAAHWERGRNTRRAIPREPDPALFICTRAAAVRTVVKCFSVCVEISGFFLTFPFIIARRHVYLVSGHPPRRPLSALTAWQAYVPEELLFFKVSPFSLPLLSADHALLDIPDLTGFLKYTT